MLSICRYIVLIGIIVNVISSMFAMHRVFGAENGVVVIYSISLADISLMTYGYILMKFYKG